MNYRLITKYKTGMIETDNLGVISNSSRVFKSDIGNTVKNTCEKYEDKKFRVRLEEINGN